MASIARPISRPRHRARRTTWLPAPRVETVTLSRRTAGVLAVSGLLVTLSGWAALLIAH